jgi:hypothetical protein
MSWSRINPAASITGVLGETARVSFVIMSRIFMVRNVTRREPEGYGAKCGILRPERWQGAAAEPQRRHSP